MMDDIINRQAAIDAVKDADVCVFYSDNQSVDDVLDYTIRATKGSVIASIEQLPSAQTEIIYCRDCIHAIKDGLCGGYWCKGKAVKSSHYCGYAERRTDDCV